jgi:hypothetical protein
LKEEGVLSNKNCESIDLIGEEDEESGSELIRVTGVHSTAIGHSGEGLGEMGN